MTEYIHIRCPAALVADNKVLFEHLSLKSGDSLNDYLEIIRSSVG